MKYDTYPKAWMLQRLWDLILFICASLAEGLALAQVAFSESPRYPIIIGLGLLSSAIALYLDYRQKKTYSANHIETSLLSNSLTVPFLNGIARARHRAAGATTLIVVVGIFISGYGVVWK